MKEYIKPNTRMFKTELSDAIALNEHSEVSSGDMNTKSTGGWDYGDDTNDW